MGEGVFSRLSIAVFSFSWAFSKGSWSALFTALAALSGSRSPTGSLARRWVIFSSARASSDWIFALRAAVSFISSKTACARAFVWERNSMNWRNTAFPLAFCCSLNFRIIAAWAALISAHAADFSSGLRWRPPWRSATASGCERIFSRASCSEKSCLCEARNSA